MSKAFTGRHGRAFLFRTVENVALGDMEDRILATGMHTISDLHCTVCRSVVGWKYLFAFEDTQKYKEGLFVIEKNRIVKHTGWSD
ncbi:hypothetical protein BASA50_008264 [Batrachochytrium salamandrivorans]|uniref:Protein yippee-like n=1 Tax=Batrachochytrium salamandrivorans TaxID=1357716 RepID=A0ABQ8F555_9FUNG|nr:hypothetical protein BASA60_007644 [Batrachochytrium salamandrivorans]KAH6576950.1 hypothetical protein BASA62_001128 [Batrachochytrium salamandrivorans]KAH6582501.1 hypothetical protein BASA61_008531 [Batrachochytrium salamandrivorans]KAH6592119.1 hypothetical protein BASA50_008264 [Batrachochytrium salamandrivorans]KAH9247077.1 hypothetical protein BASA81_015325 [Batrachochytrium salamandrivorans]